MTELSAVLRLADIGGTGGETTALLAAPGGQVDVIDIGRDGAWGAGGEALRARVAAACPQATVGLVSGPDGLRAVDLAVNLGLFGNSAKVAHLAPLLPALLADGGRLLTEIRKGSGAWPFLKGFGAVVPLGSAGAEVTRALVTPAAPARSGADWGAIARGLAGEGGFFRDGGGHSFLFVPRGETLVVTFDNLDLAMEKRTDRRPWGFSFIEKQGWSMLGVMADGWTWYRDPFVEAEFARLRDDGFFARFRRVVFYGASMGGYAAAAFMGACPGADVVAISPQSTLDRRLVPWETRYAGAWGRDFSGPTGDAAAASRAAGRVILLFDPYEPLDAAHVARFEGPNVVRLRAPLMGHRLGSSLHQMGILSEIILGALDGSLTEARFYRALRARRGFQRYQRELFKRALEKGHPALARRLGAWVMARGEHRYIRRRMAALAGEGRRVGRDPTGAIAPAHPAGASGGDI